jgi:D-alanyl-D-alanine carboxypeptidase
VKLLAAGAVAVAAVATGGTAPASANDRYAAIVVDANTGKTLFSASASARRYPASLTKMMTLYMVFEAMAAGKINKNSRVPFSAQAAAKPPTKLGVRAGGSISVEQAILGLVTKSANDAAAALGEMIAGSEPAFARMMTSKARALGMSGTVFRNASGLPDPGQFTTARDMATLGIALREHFPQYYDYFSTRSFQFGKQRLGNHNRLLGRVKGVDGIKTGYIRASGFNLVTSVVDGNRKVVAVVMGGQSGASRDAHMAELIKRHLPKASSRRGGALVARTAPADTNIVVASAATSLPKVDAPTPDWRPEASSADAGGPLTVEEAEQVDALALTAPRPAPLPKVDVGAAAARTAKVDMMHTASVEPSGWVIQIASSPNKGEAAAALEATRSKASKVLGSVSPYTVPYNHEGVIYHRARFSGFESKRAAWQACDALKRLKIGCYAVQN